ncbi:unnamed protein product [Closterium sp. Naga37s-1]|nr:unnamed protein product [Closterium sp. Naga37s-1]
MTSSPNSSGTVVRRQRPCTTPSAAAARARTSPRPVLPQPSPPVSASAGDEPSSSSDAARPPFPRVAIPTFPERKRPQGQLKRNADAQPPSPRHRMTKKVCKAITVKEKLHWLKMQDSQPDLGNRALAKLAKVQPCQVREWRKMKERLEVASSCRRRLMGSCRKAKYPFMERAVYRHFLNHQAKGLALIDDELVVNPFYAEAPVPSEELQPAEEDVAAEEEAEAAAAAEEEEWNTPEEGEEAGVYNEDDEEWWRAGCYDGEECEEWVAGDDED